MKSFFKTRHSGQGKKIIRKDFVERFCTKFDDELHKDSTQKFIRNFRIPNERELYGLLIKSFVQTQMNPDEFIATELQIARNDNNDDYSQSSVGRVDFLVNYRNVSFLIEVKVSRVSAVSAISPLNDAIPKVIRPWGSVCKQLNDISEERIKNAALKKMEKLALMIYLYVSPIKSNKRANPCNKHEQIISYVDGSNLISENFHYEYFREFEQPIECYKRKSNSMDEDLDTMDASGKINFYGFSVFASLCG
ncbi:MAG: hypothetical protein JJU30_13570 [Alkalimonas sp.]|nr:hypothetical protein [Alkalimonas sp.]